MKTIINAKPEYTVKHKDGKDVPVFSVRYKDSYKNTKYVDKRKEITDKATAELGVTCFG